MPSPPIMISLVFVSILTLLMALAGIQLLRGNLQEKLGTISSKRVALGVLLVIVLIVATTFIIIYRG